MDWKRWFSSSYDVHFLPSLVFFVLYFCVLVFNVSYYEVRFPYMDRIHIILLPALLALIFLTIRELNPTYLRNLAPRRVQFFSILIFLPWSLT